MKKYKRVTKEFVVATKEAIGRPDSVVQQLVDEVPDCECDDLRAKLEEAEKETLRLKDGLKLFIKYPPQADQIVYMLTALLHDHRGEI